MHTSREIARPKYTSGAYAAPVPDEPLECRVVITRWPGIGKFDLGMYDPISGRYEPLGRHDISKIDEIVGDLKLRMERERHRVTFTDLEGPR